MRYGLKKTYSNIPLSRAVVAHLSVGCDGTLREQSGKQINDRGEINTVTLKNFPHYSARKYSASRHDECPVSLVSGPIQVRGPYRRKHSDRYREISVTLVDDRRGESDWRFSRICASTGRRLFKESNLI